MRGSKAAWECEAAWGRAANVLGRARRGLRRLLGGGCAAKGCGQFRVARWRRRRQWDGQVPTRERNHMARSIAKLAGQFIPRSTEQSIERSGMRSALNWTAPVIGQSIAKSGARYMAMSMWRTPRNCGALDAIAGRLVGPAGVAGGNGHGLACGRSEFRCCASRSVQRKVWIAAAGACDRRIVCWGLSNALGRQATQQCGSRGYGARRSRLAGMGFAGVFRQDAGGRMREHRIALGRRRFGVEGTVMVEHPAGESGFGGLLNPLVNQGGDLFPNVRSLVQAGELEAVKQGARCCPKILKLRNTSASHGPQPLSGREGQPL